MTKLIQGTVFLVCLLMAFLLGAFIHDRQHPPIDTTAQVKHLESLPQATLDLQADLERLNSLDAQIKQLATSGDITPPPPTDLVRLAITYKGQGGPLPLAGSNDMNQLTTNLQAELKLQEQKLVEIKQEVLKKQTTLATTPSIWPARGDVTSRFGWRNSPWGSGSDWHPGIDIANNMGTPIFATADGEVVRGEWSDGYGNLVQIDHRNGIATLYGHNSQIIVHNGQLVKKGQLIAYVGSTGNSTGPHVHYEIRVNGTAVNPESFLVLK